MYIVLRKT